MPSATITSKGQVTIPKKIRDLLHLKPGDLIDFFIDEDGDVRLRPGTMDVGHLKGILHRPGRKAVSLEEMDAALSRRHRKQS